MDPDQLSLSNEFPSVDFSHEFVRLSDDVYYLKNCDDDHIPDHVSCHWYEKTSKSAQVMVVSSDELKYVAVVYAGSDDWKNWVTDADIKMSPFGPADNPINANVSVHEGFNKVVFSDGLFDRILDTVQDLLKEYPNYSLITSGHSLGGAEAILTGAALAHYLPSFTIQSISFGTPRIGNDSWRQHVNQFPNLGIWRFVHRDDIVPRLPGDRFFHVGHTIQMYKSNMEAYYLHVGDSSLGYAGVPIYWEASSFIFVPESSFHHMIGNYVTYIRRYKRDPNKYFSQSFKSIGNLETGNLNDESKMDTLDEKYEIHFVSTD